jgi:carbon-monoxide dehydrogenase medium subunit
VLTLLALRDDAKLLAGWHSLLPAMKLRLAAPAVLVDLSRVSGLNYIREGGGTVHIGAMTTHAEVAGSSLLQSVSPLLSQAAREIGDVQVRNRGTIGGSLAHADPAADYPAAVLALDAEIVAMSARGERFIPARHFFTGLFTTALAPDEVITEVRVPVTAPAFTAYRKFAHPASGMAVVGIAVVVKMRGANFEDARVGVTGVAQYAYRAASVEKEVARKTRQRNCCRCRPRHRRHRSARRHVRLCRISQPRRARVHPSRVGAVRGAAEEVIPNIGDTANSRLETGNWKLPDEA